MSLRKNTFWNLLGGGFPLLAAIFFIPYCLRQLGDETFGVLTLIWSLIGYFSLFDLGVGRALTYQMGRLNFGKDKNQIPSVLRAGLALTALTGIIGAVTMYFIAPNLAHDWLDIAPNLAADSQLSFRVAALGVIFTTIGSGLRGAQEGLENFKTSNLNKLALGFFTFFLPAFSIYFHGPELYLAVIYLVAARFFMLLINIYQLREYIFSTGVKFTIDHVKSLYTFGVWVTVSGIISPLMVYGDRFFVSAAVGAALLPLYAIPQEGLQRLLIIPGALCGALLPKLAGLPVAQRYALYRKGRKHVALIMLGVCLVCGLLAYPILSTWINQDFAKQSLPVVFILAVGIWLNSMALVSLTFLHASASTKLAAIFHLVELLIYIVSLYYLVHYFGLVGAALAWTFRVGVDLILLQWAVKRHHLI